MATKKAASTTAKAITETKSSKSNVTTIKASDSKSVRTGKLKSTFANRITSTVVLAEALAEFIGTFLLTGIVLTQQNQPIALLFALVALVLIIGGMSGAHLNPAASIGAWVTRKLDSARLVAYIVAQVLGAMLGLVVLNAFIGQAGSSSSGLSQTPELFSAAAVPAGKEWVLLFAELIGAAIIGIAYANSHRFKHDKITAAFTVGAGYFVALIIAGTVATYVNASVILNPAIAIAAKALNVATVWPVSIYVVTASIGCILGFALYDLIRRAERSVD